jgi:SagB-type dehydrogenase family enzyme
MLSSIVTRHHGPSVLPAWFYWLGEVERLGAVTYEVRHSRRPIARLEIMAPAFEPGLGGVHPRARWVLSRFAIQRRQEGNLVLESPLSCAKLHLLDGSAAATLVALARPCSIADAARIGDVPRTVAADLMSVLEYAKLIVPADAAEKTPEDAPASLGLWHAADLAFHGRSRSGRHDDRADKFRFRHTVSPLAAVKPRMSARPIPLEVPRADKISDADPPFTTVLEGRRSIRTYDDRRPITLSQLGEFLYRTARLKETIEPDGKLLLYQSSRRPYPGAGGCYELEIYPVVNRCRGLKRGIYHYHPSDHTLEPIPNSAPAVPTMMRDTLIAEDAGGPRQVVLTITARFQRVAWKYNGSSYAAILKNVGVLFQTFYLVATAMGLAPCALGGGNADLFGRVVGLPFHEESSVGEFMLGSRAPAAE